MIEPGSEGRVLFLAVGAIVLLLSSLAAARAERRGVPTPTPRPAPRWQRWLGALAVLVANAPLLRVAPWSFEHAAFGDAVTHARVADEIARTGLPHGWIESYYGGFPFGVHYPPAAWLVLASLVALSLSPLAAAHLVGWSALVATPLALYGALVRCDRSPSAAFVGACFLSWIAPRTAFTGGYEAFLRLGLVSQVCALPLVLLGASFVAKAERAGPAILWACLAMLTHPQLASVALVVQGLAAIASGRADVMERAGRAALSAGGVAIAIYGPGVASLGVPFGWPSDLGWRQLGFDPSDALAWLRDGELLDMQRALTLTDLALLALLGLTLDLRARPPRALAIALAATVTTTLCGHALAAAPLTRPLLSFLQPMRALALIAPLLAVALVLTIEQLTARLALVVPSSRRAWAHPITIGAILVLLAPAGMERLRATDVVARALRDRTRAPCGPRTPAGYDHDALAQALRALAQGRLWYDEEDASAVDCMNHDALQLESAVPLGTSLAVGTHVGLHRTLFSRLDPSREGGDARAEALGVRTIAVSEGRAPPSGRWTLQQAHGLVLWRNERAADLVGLGCVRARWRGSDTALRDAVEHADDDTLDALLDPRRLVAWERSSGSLTQHVVTTECALAGATAELVEHTPGQLAVDLEVPDGAGLALEESPFVVLRVTAYAGWELALDGEVLEATMVAPGFPAVRVPPGRHHLVATVTRSPAQPASSLVGALLFALAAAARRPRPRMTSSSRPLV